VRPSLSLNTLESTHCGSRVLHAFNTRFDTSWQKVDATRAGGEVASDSMSESCCVNSLSDIN
jgi:hypothetical protein